jgi:hypothetical protein
LPVKDSRIGRGLAAMLVDRSSCHGLAAQQAPGLRYARRHCRRTGVLVAEHLVSNCWPVAATTQAGSAPAEPHVRLPESDPFAVLLGFATARWVRWQAVNLVPRDAVAGAVVVDARMENVLGYRGATSRSHGVKYSAGWHFVN